MDIHIQIPDYILPFVQTVTNIVTTSIQRLHDGANLISSSVHGVLELPRNAYLPILAVLLVFWPVLLSMVLALATASTWIFWLFTSVMFGLLQLLYVTYQFLMISVDIMGLSILKTYSVVRSMLVDVVGKASGTSLGKSRRRLWRERMERAGTYENFLKIRIENKDEVSDLNDTTTTASTGEDSALPPVLKNKAGRLTEGKARNQMGTAIPRAQSFTDELPPVSPSRMNRTSSFSGESNPQTPAVSTNRSPSRGTIDLDPVVIQELGRKTADLLAKTTERLNEARIQAERNASSEAVASLKYLVAAVVKRNHLQLDNLVIENARSVALSGQYGLTTKSRNLIRSYFAEVQKCLDWLADSATEDASAAEAADEDEEGWLRPNQELFDRIKLVRKMKQNMGRTALMLSGGGAQAMYHLGIIRALIQSKLYDDIRVISGTSGGSIIAGLISTSGIFAYIDVFFYHTLVLTLVYVYNTTLFESTILPVNEKYNPSLWSLGERQPTAMCAMKTSDELFTDVCVHTVSTDYGLNGTQRKQNIRWFPTPMEMASYWLKNKLLMDSREFRRTCDFYYGDMTFEEAFERTGKHVCITVSASRASSATAQRLLLNHISTPHVTLASAVAASCALPGVMAPAKLMAKQSSGVLEPFEVDGVEWIDGSVQADLPFQRISTLFAVTSFIVSQTNFHVHPFLNKAHHPNQKSMYWRLFQTMEWDIRSRALKLSRLGLFPTVFGQDLSKVFKQKYHGDLTIVPRFTAMQTFGLKALSNPTVKDMEGYLKYGQIATWPYLNAIRDMIRLEKALDDSLARLEDKLRRLHPEGDWSYHEDVDSIASSSNVLSSSSARVRIVGPPPAGLSSSYRETERMRRKMETLEDENRELKNLLEGFSKDGEGDRVTSIVSENAVLKKQLQELQQRLDQNNITSEGSGKTKRDQAADGNIWKMMLGSRP